MLSISLLLKVLFGLVALVLLADIGWHPRIYYMAVRGLYANLLRSLLATLGVIIGVVAVVSAMSILEGATADIIGKFESMGSNLIYISPAQARVGGRAVGSFQTLKFEDARELTRNPYVESAAPEVMAPATVKYYNKNVSGIVLGTSESYGQMYNYRIASGRFITKEDVDGRRGVAVLGHKIAKDLFGRTTATVDHIRVNGKPFRVIGVMEKKGTLGFRNVDEQVVVPITTAMQRLFGMKSVQTISVRAVGGDVMDKAVVEIKKSLRRSHRVRVGQKDDFNVFKQEEIMKQVSDVTTLFAIVLYSIAGISLVVGGIGIMNIMLVAVTERTREIGVRMAVGAQRSDILKQFLAESGIVSCVGGAGGVLFAYALLDLLETTTPLDTMTPPRIVVYALTMAIVTGVVSGLYPAWKASRLDPVEALRYE